MHWQPLTRAVFIGAFPGTMTAHTARMRHLFSSGTLWGSVCVRICPVLPSHQVLQSWEIVDPGGKCRPMCTQEHCDTSTQRWPSKTLPTAKKKNDVITTSKTVTDGEKRRCREWALTRACAAIHTLFLADLLDVETMAGCRAGLGAFTVLHPNWTLGD